MVLCGEGGVAGRRHEDGVLLKFCFLTLSAGYTDIFSLYTWDLCMFLCVCYVSVNSFPFLQSHMLKKKKSNCKNQNKTA